MAYTLLAGPVVGPVSGLPAGVTTTTTNTGQGVDFAIGGLEFKLAISDERPYERATAQFRKDQIDQTPTVGDQSLTGWWTRGQFSFHKGAGVTYYEVLEGEEILDRFNTANGVMVDTPGEVSLAPDLGNWTSTGFDLTTNGRAALCDNTLYLCASTSSLKFSTSGAALSTYTLVSGTPRDVTSDGTNVFVATSATGSCVERAAKGATTGTALYSHTTGLKDIAYAKGRLFVRDDNGNVYHLPAYPSGTLPVAIASGDLVISMPNETASVKWFFCETRGGVYMAGQRSRLIQYLDLDSTGDIPTLSAPVVVAELPVGEVLRGMHTYLGYAVLVTDKGIRVALQQEDGSLTYGPLIVEVSVPEDLGTTMSAKGSIVYANLGDDIYAVNLGVTIGDSPLVCAYTIERTETGAVGTLRGGEIVWGQTIAKVAGSNLISSGSITTGYHRFGTFEPKRFHSVKVRTGGNGGTINVSRVMSDGSVVSLLVIDALTGFADDITLGLNGTHEMIGLKFTLNRSGTDATKGPILLGYQLRALPAPKRQRMIRVPLKLFDVERRGTAPASGREDSAWSRLSALEDMEQTGGTFTFQDFRTGEAGECYIESIEHKGVTPPGKQGDGFGGVVWLTLRKL